MNEPSTNEVLREHRYEIDALKEQSSETNRNISRLIDSMNGLSQNFAVYAEKHDRTQSEIERLRVDSVKISETVQGHEIILAGHKPVIESLRKLNNRLIGAALLFIASNSAIAYIALA